MLLILGILNSGVLLFVWIYLAKISGKVAKIECLMSARPPEEGGGVGGTILSVNEPSVFEEFLKEDPQRLLLSKSEQSAAYRRWRRENGMTWSK
ncbi:MAG: hypothetical protein QM680_11415 [Luteolibacter sp.]